MQLTQLTTNNAPPPTHATQDTYITHIPECKPELPGHGAVEDEVDHAVHKGHHLHQLQEKEKGCFQKTK